MHDFPWWVQYNSMCKNFSKVKHRTRTDLQKGWLNLHVTNRPPLPAFATDYHFPRACSWKRDYASNYIVPVGYFTSFPSSISFWTWIFFLNFDGTLLLSYLFFGNSHVILNIREHCGLDEEALVAMLCASIHQICPFLVSTLYQRQYLSELLLVHLSHREQASDN